MPGFWWWECARAKSRDRQSAITRRARCHLSNPLSIIPMFAFSQTILTDYLPRMILLIFFERRLEKKQNRNIVTVRKIFFNGKQL